MAEIEFPSLEWAKQILYEAMLKGYTELHVPECMWKDMKILCSHNTMMYKVASFKPHTSYNTLASIAEDMTEEIVYLRAWYMPVMEEIYLIAYAPIANTVVVGPITPKGNYNG